MKFLLEFNDFEDDDSLIKTTVEDVILSEVYDDIKINVEKSYIILENDEIRSSYLKMSGEKANVNFPAWNISISKYRLDEEEFENISKAVEHILTQELGEPIYCFFGPNQNLSWIEKKGIDKFTICKRAHFEFLQSILDFENAILEAIEEINLHEFQHFVGIEFQDQNDYGNPNKKSIDFIIEDWNLKIKFDISRYPERAPFEFVNRASKFDFAKGKFIYYIKPSISFSNNFFSSSRNKIEKSPKLLSDLSIDSDQWNPIKAILKESPSQKKLGPSESIRSVSKIIQNIREISNKLVAFEFELDVNKLESDEAERLLDLLVKDLFPQFRSESIDKMKKLYNQFDDLENFEIDANWSNEGNNLYLFDINYKNSEYIFKVKYDLERDLVNIETDIDDNIIKEVVPVDEFANTIFLILQEN